MTHDPATIAAFVDGELDDLTARRIEREAANDAALAAEIRRQRELKDRLRSHFAPVLDEPLPDRLTQLLRAEAAVDTSLAERRAARQARFGGQWGAMQWGAMAAALVLGLTVGMQPWGPASPVAVESGALVASGPLANALDTQLASNQPADAATRIGLSFRAQDGRYCRSFESAAVDGIACREGEGWTLEQTLRGSPATDYRQASSASLAAASAAMMAGEPLDAEGERAARDAGWKRGRGE
ncbi:anti-sigma factor [Sphingopyxis sp. XHP0097]|uniref:Anti-sigma factor n=1 Tax=Sphingopyxis jiangsuensis TaxID=2871171 RepID=A0ABS7MH98_9SPHN|nr:MULTISPECIES: NepR family anti-sigma factor [Sphingopyxis]MBY4638121.1 anti-sigma factor [Sphingopyxis jiangsuensis]